MLDYTRAKIKNITPTTNGCVSSCFSKPFYVTSLDGSGVLGKVIYPKGKNVK